MVPAAPWFRAFVLHLYATPSAILVGSCRSGEPIVHYGNWPSLVRQCNPLRPRRSEFSNSIYTDRAIRGHQAVKGFSQLNAKISIQSAHVASLLCTNSLQSQSPEPCPFYLTRRAKFPFFHPHTRLPTPGQRPKCTRLQGAHQGHTGLCFCVPRYTPWVLSP